jgi:hypothetical protein
VRWLAGALAYDAASELTGKNNPKHAVKTKQNEHAVKTKRQSNEEHVNRAKKLQNNMSASTTALPSIPTDTTVDCPVCGESFNNQFQVNIHLNYGHKIMNRSINSVKCNVCSWTGKTGKGLAYHKQVLFSLICGTFALSNTIIISHTIFVRHPVS